MKPPVWSRLKKIYGISEVTYNKILHEQGHACYICLRDPRQFKAKKYKHNLCVDHCHTTGMIRGLLCRNCNTHISRWLRDDPEMIQRVHKYLTKKKTYGKVPEDE